MTGLNKMHQIERVSLTDDFSISRVVKGGWQLSAGHSAGHAGEVIHDMWSYAGHGITTFDCADIYTGVESLIGQFLAERKKRLGHHDDIQVLTKFVPDLDVLPTITKSYVEKIIDRSLRRLGLERLDMVQFSWWDYRIPRYVETAHWLAELQRAGKIRLLSGTNFNASALQELAQAGLTFSTLQLQYSLLDRRPEKLLQDQCAQVHTRFLCYGTLAGGFLSNAWLNQPEPRTPLANRSLVKYKLILDACGGWDVFQALLQVLQEVALRHHTSIANVAARYILEQDQVAAVIIGARHAAHLSSQLEVFSFRLDDQDKQCIRAAQDQLTPLPGDAFDLERDKEGPHGSIMRYNLNQLATD